VVAADGGIPDGGSGDGGGAAGRPYAGAGMDVAPPSESPSRGSGTIGVGGHDGCGLGMLAAGATAPDEPGSGDVSGSNPL
jgi:hypothetical protein